MHPEIASIHERLEKGGDWMEFRHEIARLHGEATTQDEYVTLLEAHRRLVAVAEHCFDAEKCSEIRRIAFGEYKMFLNVEAMENGTINPIMLDRITAREVESGRLPADDGLRTLAAAGTALGDSADMRYDRTPGNLAAICGLVLGVIAWFLFDWRFGLAALATGMVIGWAINEYRRKAAISGAQTARATRGYD